MPGENIFSTLAKYNSATDENYLTESFVFLLNSLLEKEQAIGLEILNMLCVENNEFCFDTNEAISVSTQDVTEEGTPDIKVSTSDKLIYIEVKHDSPLGYQQIERYKKALEASSAIIKQVILLTHYSVDFEKTESKPYKHIYWRNVYQWLENTRAQDLVILYLINSFKSFLEEKQMAIQKVGWEYINGVPAINNLVNMIEVGIEGASLHIHKKSSGHFYRGFLIENKEYWCGVFYDDPLVVRFEIEHQEKFDFDILEPTYEIWENNRLSWFRLPLEDIHFFSIDKDEQLEEITKFLKTAYAEAQKMRIKSKPTRKSRTPKP